VKRGLWLLTVVAFVDCQPPSSVAGSAVPLRSTAAPASPLGEVQPPPARPVVAPPPPPPAVLSVVVEGACENLDAALLQNATLIHYGHVPGKGEAHATRLVLAFLREDGSLDADPKLERGLPTVSNAYTGGIDTDPLDVTSLTGTWPDDAQLRLVAESGNRMGTEADDYEWATDHWAPGDNEPLEAREKPRLPWLAGSKLARGPQLTPYPVLTVVPAGAAPTPDFTALHVAKTPSCQFMESDLLTRPGGELFLAGKFCGIYPTHEHGEWRYDGNHPPVMQGEASVAHWVPGGPATIMAIPPVANRAALELDEFLEASPTSMYLFGRVTHDSGPPDPYLAFYDGTAWSRVDAPYKGQPSTRDLEADGTLWLSDSAHDVYRRAPDGTWTKEPLGDVVNVAWRRHRPAWVVALGSVLRHDAGDTWTEVELPHPAFSTSASLTPRRVYLSPAGEVWVKATYEEQRPEWKTPAKREALLRLGTPTVAARPANRCDGEIGPSIASWPPPATASCQEPVVILARVSQNAPATFAFPQTRTALRGHPEIAGAELVEIDLGGQRLLAAKVASVEQGTRVAELVGHGVPGAHPEIVCGSVKVTRSIAWDERKTLGPAAR
jgi:hypothetical protein